MKIRLFRIIIDKNDEYTVVQDNVSIFLNISIAIIIRLTINGSIILDIWISTIMDYNS